MEINDSNTLNETLLPSTSMEVRKREEEEKDEAIKSGIAEAMKNKDGFWSNVKKEPRTWKPWCLAIVVLLYMGFALLGNLGLLKFGMVMKHDHPDSQTFRDNLGKKASEILGFAISEDRFVETCLVGRILGFVKKTATDIFNGFVVLITGTRQIGKSWALRYALQNSTDVAFVQFGTELPLMFPQLVKHGVNIQFLRFVGFFLGSEDLFYDSTEPTFDDYWGVLTSTISNHDREVILVLENVRFALEQGYFESKKKLLVSLFQTCIVYGHNRCILMDSDSASNEWFQIDHYGNRLKGLFLTPCTEEVTAHDIQILLENNEETVSDLKEKPELLAKEVGFVFPELKDFLDNGLSVVLEEKHATLEKIFKTTRRSTEDEEILKKTCEKVVKSEDSEFIFSYPAFRYSTIATKLIKENQAHIADQKARFSLTRLGKRAFIEMCCRFYDLKIDDCPNYEQKKIQ